MAQTKGQRIATDAVAAEMARREWTKQDFADASGLDYGTVSDFLSYERSAQTKTQAAIEKTFRWVPGTYRKIALGAIDEPVYLDSAESVSPSRDTENAPAWNTRKPEWMSDEQWTDLIRENRSHFEFLIQQAAKER